MKRIGIFICHCGINIATNVDVERVAEELSKYPGVVRSEHYTYMCSDPGQDLIKKSIREDNLDAVVVAACSPNLHLVTFRRTSQAAGLNPYLCEEANIREQCSWVHDDRETATAKAVKLIQAMVEKVMRNEPLVPVKVPVTKRALVIGGGISGMQAALDVANSGYETLLVERNPSIGGHMAQLSETFPTLDCSQCIMTPKMVEVAQNPLIKLYTCAEVEEVSGYVGNFNVKIKQKSRFVDWGKCNGCGECATVCPVEYPREFDEGLSKRGAIHRPFPQAVPNKFSIDKRGTAPCRYACPAGVNAQGYVALVSKGKYKEALALEREDNPFPSVCGRVCTHPCERECARASYDGAVAIRNLKRFIADYEDVPQEIEKPEKKQQKVAIIGAGPAGLTCAYYLARRGYPVKVFDSLKVPGGMLVAGIPRFRLPQSAISADINHIRSWGVELELGKTLGEDFKMSDLLSEGYGAVFVGTGAWKERRLGIDGEDLEGVKYCIEFLRRVNLEGDSSIGKKVAVVGGGNAAVDSARVALRCGAEEVVIVYRRSRKEMPADEEEIVAAEEEGVEIEYLSAPIRVIGQGGKVTGMECIKMELGEPDATGRRRPTPVEGSEYIMKVDTILVAISQSPDLSCFEGKDKLDSTRWETLVVDPDTLQTSIPGVFAAGDAVSGAATVIEAVSGGKEAAESIDRYLRGVDLKEGRKKDLVRVEELPKPDEEIPRTPVRELPAASRSRSYDEVQRGYTEEEARTEASRCLSCAICCECMECVKVCEPGAIEHEMKDEVIEEQVGAIVVATGYDVMPKERIEEYNYGNSKDVITGLQFERLLSASGPTSGEVRRPSDGKIPKEVVFIQCAGSREPERYMPYCSKICCMYTAKHAMLYKHRVHDGQPYVFYIDIRSGGKGYEEFVQRATDEDGVIYFRGKVSKIFQEGDKVVVWGADTLTGKKIEIYADMVVLATAILPSLGADGLAKKLKIGTDEHGFLAEAHPKLRPVESLTSGVFLAGAAQAPKDIPETVAQASGAASKVVALFSKDELEHEPTVSEVDEELCAGCGYCVEACAYDAIELDTKRKVARVNEVLCEGCGGCAATCPSGAIRHRNFGRKQVLDMVLVATEDF